MRMLFIINTPGQAHTWKHVMSDLAGNGHELKIIARDYGSTPAILNASSFNFETFKPVGSGFSRLMGAGIHFQRCYQLSRQFSPSVVIGFGIDAAVTAARLRVPSIVFTDDDHLILQNRVTSLLGNTIITPDCFLGNLGDKHIRVRGYKELAYLHPNYFRPDVTVVNELKINEGEKYAILRLNSWDAVHDIGARGFSVADQFKLVRELEKHVKVFISPEGRLPPVLEPYRLPIRYDRFHHAIFYSQMVVGDTGTALAEAAVLGIPSVLCSDLAASMGNFQDLYKRGLLFPYKDGSPAISKAVELIQQPDLKDLWDLRRRKMLADRIDVGKFMVNLIESTTGRLAAERKIHANWVWQRNA